VGFAAPLKCVNFRESLLKTLDDGRKVVEILKKDSKNNQNKRFHEIDALRL